MGLYEWIVKIFFLLYLVWFVWYFLYFHKYIFLKTNTEFNLQLCISLHQITTNLIFQRKCSQFFFSFWGCFSPLLYNPVQFCYPVLSKQALFTELYVLFYLFFLLFANAISQKATLMYSLYKYFVKCLECVNSANEISWFFWGAVGSSTIDVGDWN